MTRSRANEFPLLKQFGLKACQIRGDGNCLFNALSDQIFGSQAKHSEIRGSVIQYMRENPEKFKPFICVSGTQRRNPKRKNAGALSSSFSFTAATESETDAAYEAHLKSMAQGGTYGDNLEIIAFSQAYNTDVKIYRSAYSYYIRAAEDGIQRPVAHIAYHDWEHYSSVRNINGPFTGLPHVQVTEPSSADNAKVTDSLPKNQVIHDWMIKAVTTSLPHLIDQATIRKTLEECKGNVDDAVSKLLDSDYLSSQPSSPGALSSPGSSSVEREPDSDDDEIYGPNKRQNRRIIKAKAIRKEKARSAKQEEDELSAIPTTIASIELSQSDAQVASEIPAQHRGTNTKSNTRKAKKGDDDDEFVPSDDDIRSYQQDDAVSKSTGSSRNTSVSLSSTAPSSITPNSATPSSTTSHPQPKIILRTKSMQKQAGPQTQTKRLPARERKELKKAAQKQARKETKRTTAKKASPKPQTSTAKVVKRSSPPMEQVMTTLYI